ncbi:MAG: hypothetical protein L3J50_07905, partial [Emcibacter sp.]|nr:hypothetical protein [Emcibacter sp.]
MAINKKGSRKITVNGHDFRWRTIGNDKFITLVLWPVKNKNSRVVGRIGYYNNVFPLVQDPITTNEHVKITNRLVREVILHCGVKNIVENEGQLNVGSLEDIENIKKVIMDICSRIRKARGGHDTIVGIKEIEVKFAAQAAEMFNLSSLPSVYHEIENTESISILTSALHNSMVWPDCEL